MKEAPSRLSWSGSLGHIIHSRAPNLQRNHCWGTVCSPGRRVIWVSYSHPYEKGCVVPVAGTDVRTGDYKHLRGLLRSVCQVSSPLVNATLGGPLAVLTRDSSVGLSVKAAA